MNSSDDSKAGGPRFPRLFALRRLPMVVILLGFIAFMLSDARHAVSFENLSRNHEEIHAWVQLHPARALLGYGLIYVVIAAFALPLSAWATLGSGYLFGPWVGTALVVVSATLGAVILFLAARGALSGLFRARAGGFVQRLEDGFKKDAFNYLLVLRLIPILPFAIVNIVPALLGVRLKIFIAATVIGILPASFIYVWLGNGLGTILARGEAPNFDVIFEPRILCGLIGLALLALLPLAFRGRTRAGTQSP